MRKQRVEWIDVAKAMLIICVILTHLPAFAHQNGMRCFEWMETLRPWFNPYFMPAFFIITGYCSSMEGGFKAFAIKNFKLLMIPNIIVSIGIPASSMLLSRQTDPTMYASMMCDSFLLNGGFWFLSSLFFGKLILWFVCRVTESSIGKTASCLGLLVIGVACHDLGISNFWYWQNTLIAVFFLSTGHAARRLRPVETCCVPVMGGVN